jgi:hypothetical protein
MTGYHTLLSCHTLLVLLLGCYPGREGSVIGNTCHVNSLWLLVMIDGEETIITVTQRLT